MPKDIDVYSEQEIRDKICCLLAGWFSEKEFFGEITNGAIDVFKKHEKLLRKW